MPVQLQPILPARESTNGSRVAQSACERSVCAESMMVV